MGIEKYKLFIYGAGKYGKLLLRHINIILGGGIDYFVQTNEPNCERIEGIPVISLKTMAKIKADKIIFIAMNNTRVIREIEKNIFEQCGSDNLIRVYNCRNFISDNLLVTYSTDTSGSKQCVVCGNHVRTFLPGGIENEIFRQHHIVGGGLRQNCKCPCCGAIDRERWLYYVLEKYTDISRISGKVLHFAPEGAIETHIRRNVGIDYYSCDLAQGKAMHVVDITDIPYKDGLFDYVICNHVLEHIADEEKAVSEIKRVLKENGKWIFSFPICTDMRTYEDRAITSPEQRLKAYGQTDHVRLYGNDFAERFERYGLKIRIYSPRDELEEAQIDKYGFIRDDIILMAEKI